MIDWMSLLGNIPWWTYLLFVLVILASAFQPKNNKRNNPLKYNKHRPINTVNSNSKSMYQTIGTKEKNNSSLTAKEKGNNYEEHVCKYFEKLGYKTVEHGKMHGVEDKGIDLMLKKGKEFIFVQCKDWDIKNKYRIDSKEIQYTRMNVRDYIENKKALFDMYEWKIFYITSDNILDRSAEHKIREYNHEIEHRVVVN